MEGRSSVPRDENPGKQSGDEAEQQDNEADQYEDEHVQRVTPRGTGRRRPATKPLVDRMTPAGVIMGVLLSQGLSSAARVYRQS